MRNSPHLTAGYDPVFARQIEKTRAGMASWAACGPFGTTCAECVHYGYWKQVRDVAGNIATTTFRQGACAMSYRLSHKHGPPVPASNESCRYFERREKESD
jgi:hypothetical protein